MGGRPNNRSIEIGVFHAMHGPMALSELPISQAVQMAIDEVNRRGGVLGRTVKPHYIDYESSAATAATAASYLVDRCGVRYLFGGWMSGARRAILRAIDGKAAQFWYPNHYEGFEETRNCIYTGSTVNQLLLPAFELITCEKRRRILLIGADNEFSLTVHAAAKLQCEHAGIGLVGEILLSWTSDLAGIQELVEGSCCDAILCTVQGQLLVDLFTVLRRDDYRGSPEGIAPVVVVTSMSEVCASRLGHRAQGIYSVSGFFQSVATAEQRSFVDAFQDRFGRSRVTSEPMANAYAQVLCWQQIVNDIGTLDPQEIRSAVPGYQYRGAAGWWNFQANFHVRKPMLLGQFDEAGQILPHTVSTFDIEPDPWFGMADQGSRHGRMIRELVQSLSERAQYARESQIKADNYACELDELSFINAHSLREPVRTTLGLLAVLRDELTLDTSMEVNSTLGMLEAMAERMSAMSNAMLELSLIGRREELSLHDLNRSLERAWHSLSEHPAWPSTHFHSAALPVVLGRHEDLLCLWQHIFSNCLSYREPSRPLTISVTVEDQSFRWRICVDDNGRGIPLGRQTQCLALFKSFGIADRDAGHRAGAGLSVVRKVCRSLGGALELETSPLGGVRVVIQLPKNLPDERSSKSPSMYYRFMPNAEPGPRLGGGLPAGNAAGIPPNPMHARGAGQYPALRPMRGGGSAIEHDAAPAWEQRRAAVTLRATTDRSDPRS